MIFTPRAFRILAAYLVMAPILVLSAQPCHGNEPTTIDTNGVSVTFDEKWHVQTNGMGTILGSINGEEPPLILIDYADDSMTDVRSRGNMYERMKRASIADVMGGRGRTMEDESKWHRHDIIHRTDGITEEQLDLETTARNDDGKVKDLCAFIRFYHGAPHAELYLTFTMDKSCEDTRAEFDNFTRSIIWK